MHPSDTVSLFILFSLHVGAARPLVVEYTSISTTTGGGVHAMHDVGRSFLDSERIMHIQALFKFRT